MSDAMKRAFQEAMAGPLGERFKAVYDANPICMRCKTRPSELIPYFSSYGAVCRQCLHEMERERDESFVIQEEEPPQQERPNYDDFGY